VTSARPVELGDRAGDRVPRHRAQPLELAPERAVLDDELVLGIAHRSRC
jgi:hypothetical protein